MRFTISIAAAGLAVAAAPAMALTVVPSTDAFDLAAALAPAPGLLQSVSGSFVDAPGANAIGTFSGAFPTLGFDAGVILSTGDATEAIVGTYSTNGVDFGSSPLADTASLLAQVPGGGVGLFDATRLSLSIDPGFDTVYLNFDFAYGTNEIGATTDRVGIFVNGVYFGLLNGAPIDQFNAWALPAGGGGFGFGTNLYPDGNVLDYPSFTLSLFVEQPGSPLLLDFIVADVTDGGVDTAILLGNLRGSLQAEGALLQPVPVPAAAWLLGSALAGLGAVARRRTA